MVKFAEKKSKLDNFRANVLKLHNIHLLQPGQFTSLLFENVI